MPPPNGVNPGKSQVNLTLSQQSINSFNELSAAINQAKSDLLQLKNQFQVFMGPNGLQDMKTLAGLMKQVSIGVNSIGASNRTTVTAQRNALFSTPQQTQGAMYANEIKAAEKLLQAEKDRQVLQESMVRRRASAVQNITDLETAQLRLEAAKVRLARDLETGTQSTIANSRQYLAALEQQTAQLVEQEKIATRIRNQQINQQIRQQLNPQQAPKTPQEIAQEQQQARLNKVQGILGDGGGAIFAVQAGLLANYQIMNGMTAAFKYAIQFSTELDAAFHELQAITGSTNTEMVDMRNNLLDVAQQSKFTATEVAQAAVVLGQAGLSVQQIKDSMQAITALAAASGTDLKKATDALTGVMGAFDMSANQSKDIANTMTQALNVSKLDIEKLSMGIQYAGNTAQQSGVSFKEMTAILSALANAGIRSGSTLGTGLRQIMIDIEKPTAKFKEVLDRLGLGLSDVDIKSHGLTQVLQTLQNAGFTSADAFASFEVRAAAAFNALNGNMDKVKEMNDALDRTDAVIKANEVQMNSFNAQSSRLKSNLGILISTALQPLINVFTSVARVLGDLTGGAASFNALAEIIGTTLAGATMGTALVMMGKLVIGLKDLVIGLVSFQETSAAVAASAGALKIALTAISEAPLLAGGIIGAAVVGLGTLAYALTTNASAMDQAKAAEDRATAATNQYRSALNDKQQSITTINGKIDELVSRQNHLKESDGSLQQEVKGVEAMFSKFGKTLDDNAKQSVPNLIKALQNLRKELGLAQNLALLNQSLETQKQSSTVVLRTMIQQANPSNFNPKHSIMNGIIQGGMDGVYQDGYSGNGIDVGGWKDTTRAKPGEISTVAKIYAELQKRGVNTPMNDVQSGITALNGISLELATQLNKANAANNGPDEERVRQAQTMVNRTLDYFTNISNKLKEIADTAAEQADNKKKQGAADLPYHNHMDWRTPGQVGSAHRSDVNNEYDHALKQFNKPRRASTGVQMESWLNDAYGLASASWDKAELNKSDQPNTKLREFTANTKVAETLAKAFMGQWKTFQEAQDKGYGEAYKRAQEVVDFIEGKKADYKKQGMPLYKQKIQSTTDNLTQQIRELEQQAANWTGDPKQILALGRKAQALLMQKMGVQINAAKYEKGGADGSMDVDLEATIAGLKDSQQRLLHEMAMKFKGYAKARQEKLEKAAAQLKADAENMAFKDETVQIEKGMKELTNTLSNALKKVNQPLTNLQRQESLMKDPRYSMLYSQTENDLMAQRVRQMDDSLNPGRLAVINKALKGYQDKYNQANSEVAVMTADRATKEQQYKAIDPYDVTKDEKRKQLQKDIEALTSKIVTREGEAADAKLKVLTYTEQQEQLEQKIAQTHPAQTNWWEATKQGMALTAKSWDENATLIDGLVGSFAKAKDATASYFDSVFTYTDKAKQQYGSFGVYLREQTKSMMASVLQNVMHTINQILAQKMLLAMLSAFGISTTTTAAPGGATGYMGGGKMVLPSSSTAIRGGLVVPGGIRHMAGGGMISGPIRGQDSQLILGMPGEVVMNKSAVDAVGADTLMALNAMGNSQVSKSGGSIKPIDETKRNRPVHTNVWVVTPDQKPQMGPNDVIAVVSDDLTRGGSIKQLVKSVVQGY